MMPSSLPGSDARPGRVRRAGSGGVFLALILTKPNYRSFLCVACAILALGHGITAVSANEKNSKKLDNAIEMLQGAKKASDPMPMLVSARNALNEANKGDKTGERRRAMEYVKAAIAELKTGDKKKMEEKINAAIANIQSGKSKVKSK